MKSDSGPNGWKYAGFASAAGGNLVVWMLGGYYGGSALAGRTGQKVWVSVGLLAGLAVALIAIVLMIKRILEETNE